MDPIPFPGPARPALPWHRVVLLGFMAAGKSTLGPLLAHALGWTFLDGDAELARRSGVSVPEWFRRFGEGAFRQEEARLTAELCRRDELVLAPGGGWAVGPGVLESLPHGTALVWLRVSLEEAVRRATAEGTPRPLLAGPDPVLAARRLLAAREPYYARADFVIDVDGRTPVDLTMAILAWLKTSSS
ncbi:MAG: shikimate kinase [Gemmatimonadetes bacterium]|nr:shikimate kinase [Gemmatimonadota bacterium]